MTSNATTIRCAIYTRKSSDEGLEQGFNSLDAQYEACVAYVASQKPEGWILAKDRFDDGGVSGGTLERPGLQRLLAEIETGRIGMVVVYKIDRLTRSLADFARLVERLDAAGCSFVSVTQSFNTASSMGRLTLNVLLSFAQFEREVTAERIRDKIAASKKKGLWMGGVPPLGYDPPPDPRVRVLAVNAAEAETVRTLFALCAQASGLAVVEREAARLGLRSKRHAFRSGRTQGGNPLSRGQIHKILTNPVYIGLIRHKDRNWPGQHLAIVPRDLWDRVQAELQAASGRPRGRSGDASSPHEPSPLRGKLRDETGDRLTPTHTVRHGRKVRYYVSNRLIRRGSDPTGWRLPAPKLEEVITRSVADHIAAANASHRLLAIPDIRDIGAVHTRAEEIAEQLRAGDAALLRALLVAGTLADQTLALSLDPDALSHLLGISSDNLASQVLSLTVPIRLRRRGVEMKFVSGATITKPDPVLRDALGKAHCWAQALKAGTPLHEIARAAGHHDALVRMRIPLAFLSPKIQRAILDGTQPVDLTLERLVRQSLPLDWQDQERLCGF
ncbi:MAG TPA: recombinase family protein [Tabrizicola sp.]|nr:recombinase family protein [Tabrizicola sp.]